MQQPNALYQKNQPDDWPTHPDGITPSDETFQTGVPIFYGELQRLTTKWMAKSDTWGD